MSIWPVAVRRVSRGKEDAVERPLDEIGTVLAAGAHILVGALFAGDGAQKLLGCFGGSLSGASAAIVLIAGAIELFGGALIAARSRVLRGPGVMDVRKGLVEHGPAT
jgi:hypothetical protein